MSPSLVGFGALSPISGPVPFGTLFAHKDSHVEAEPFPTMKLVVAIIQHHTLNDVKDALIDLGFQGMTVSEVKGFGRQKGHSETYRGAEYTIEFVPKVRIDLAVEDARAGAAVEVIERKARTGKIGDGKIFLFDMVEAIRIRTGERGVDAL